MSCSLYVTSGTILVLAGLYCISDLQLQHDDRWPGTSDRKEVRCLGSYAWQYLLFTGTFSYYTDNIITSNGNGYILEVLIQEP